MKNELVLYIILPLVCYFIGSLSTAVILSKKIANIDIREEGSKNAGSTNVFRVLGAKWGIINFIFDVLKGLLPTLAGLFIARSLDGAYDGYLGAVLAASGILIGHAFPIFSHFKGGKCVASMTGIMFVLYPLLTSIVFVIAVIIILTTRRVSIASVSAFVTLPICVWLFKDFFNLNLAIQIFTTIVSVFIIFLHRENIKRLFRGEESKLDLKKKFKKTEVNPK